MQPLAASGQRICTQPLHVLRFRTTTPVAATGAGVGLGREMVALKFTPTTTPFSTSQTRLISMKAILIEGFH